MTAPVLELENLSVAVRRDGAFTPVVSDVSLVLGQGEKLGMLGESGSGKTVTAMAVAGLLDPELFRVSGRVMFEGRDLLAATPRTMRGLRGTGFALVFQDAMAALDPLRVVGQQVEEAIREPSGRSAAARAARRRQSIDLLGQVGLRNPREVWGRLPGQLSGGMQQRVVIAMAIANSPALLIADEPTTALDVTVQAQILRLLARLCDERDMALLMISHDVGVIGQLCERIVAFYAGQVIEAAPAGDVLERPLHPYTSGLFQSVPSEANRGRRIPALPVASQVPVHGGCRFAPRCQYRVARCDEPQVLADAGGHLVRCHRSPEQLPVLPGVR